MERAGGEVDRRAGTTGEKDKAEIKKREHTLHVQSIRTIASSSQ